MLIYLFKLALTALIILAAEEAAKRSATLGAVIVALPLVSIVSMTWLYWDTRDSAKVGAFAREIFLLLPISLLFFVPFLFEPRTHWPYWLNFGCGLFALALGVAGLRLWR